MKLFNDIKQRIALRKERKAKEMLDKVMTAYYKDAFDFAQTIKRCDVSGMSLPCFCSRSHFLVEGSVTAHGVGPNAIMEIVAQECSKALSERAHALDIGGVSVDGVHQDGNFVLQLRFRELPNP